MTFDTWHLLTRDGEPKLLPVTPHISCPHSRKSPDARERGARQNKGSLPLNVHESAENENIVNRINVQQNQYLHLHVKKLLYCSLYLFILELVNLCYFRITPIQVIITWLHSLTCALHKLQSVRTDCAGCNDWTAAAVLTYIWFLSSIVLQPPLFV